MNPVPGEFRSVEWLEESLSALDRVYFDDHLTELGVSIRWRKWRPTKNYVFGWCHYDNVPPLIEIHRSLAWNVVPAYVLLGVIFHEALHITVGVEHDLTFNLAERRYVHQAESAAWLADHEVWLHTAPRPF